MAEQVAGAFLSPLGQNLFDWASSNFTDYFPMGKLDKLVEELESKIESIKQVLDDAEIKHYTIPDVKKWLSDVKHAMYEADQLLDEIATDALLKKLKAESQPSTWNIVNFIPTFSNSFKSRIKNLIKSLDSLAGQKDKLQLKNQTSASNAVGFNSETSCLVGASHHIYGRDGDKDEMIKILLSSENGSSDQTPIISIVGLGGMGKTTFAKFVYNDNKIVEHFELNAWVYVSKTCGVVGLTKDILKTFEFPADGEQLNLLQHQLQSSLMGKKYLLVLDGVWNENEEFWDQLLLPFNHESSGSKIIVTTRDKKVANALNSKIFDLQQLDKSSCWNLFATHAFHGNNVCQYPKLESIGKKIVYKCGGLPLALKTMGRLLAKKKLSELEWIKMFETDMWRLPDVDNKINPVLRLSYHNLSFDQKRCFAYCSIFPKGYDFEKGELIKFWMAEGLLSIGNKSEEEYGNEIFSELESISFFQQSFHTIFDMTKHNFVMHDLVNDLAKSVSGEFCMKTEGAKEEVIPKKTRHIRCFLQLSCVDNILEPICKVKGLRSLILEGNMSMLITNNLQHYMFSRLKCLRMLSFRNCYLLELDNEIGNLKLLRYLDLSYTKIKSLPDTICMLYNLQTLLLEGCEMTELPSNFSKLINLRHLELPFDLNDDPVLKKMPKNIGKLNNLQTLSYFTVEAQNEIDLKELEKLNNLHGRIYMKGLGNVNNHAYAEMANLKGKLCLEELKMDFYKRREEMDDSIVERNVSVLEALQPNSKLMKLTIENYNGNCFPNWLRDCDLSSLVSLKLQNCGLCSHLPALGQLSCLKELSISDCDGIKTIGKEFYYNNSTILPVKKKQKTEKIITFKFLEVLKFERMVNWEEWFGQSGGFPELKELYIKGCPKLKRELPQHLPSLKKLKIVDCQMMEVLIPNNDSIIELDLQRCGSILVNELPTNLKRLVIRGNQSTKFSMEQNLVGNTCLEVLELDFSGDERPSLNLGCYGSLRSLLIIGWPYSSLPFSLHSFTKLDLLWLYNFPYLESFPSGGWPSTLSHLVISNFPKLSNFQGEWNLFQLYSLSLVDCPELETIPREGFPSYLSWLEIRNCPKLIALRETWSLSQLNSLKYFTASDEFENVVSFPEENLLPPTLVWLTLNNCSKLKRLNSEGFLHLNSLKLLYIDHCPSLERLPEGLLNSLSRLEIDNCPLIKDLYKKEGGKHWHTIRHIPIVGIF